MEPADNKHSKKTERYDGFPFNAPPKIGRSALKAFGLCLVGVLLGRCYLALAFVEWDLGAGFILVILCTPAIYYAFLGVTTLVGGRWILEELLFVLPILALGLDLLLIVIQIFLANSLNLGHLPDEVILVSIAAACFLRAFRWLLTGTAIAKENRAKRSTRQPEGEVPPS